MLPTQVVEDEKNFDLEFEEALFSVRRLYGRLSGNITRTYAVWDFWEVDEEGFVILPKIYLDEFQK